MSPLLVQTALVAVMLSSTASPQVQRDPLLEPVPPAPRQISSWDEAVTLWSAHNPDLQVSAAEVMRAAGRHRVALAALLPNISGSGLASFSLLAAPAGEGTATAALFGAAPYQTLSAVAQLAIIDARAWNAVAAAKDAETATRLSFADSRRLLLVNLAQSLLSVLVAERLAELNRVGLQDALSRLSLGERANRAGASTEMDLSRLRQDADLARAQVVNGDETLRQARESLALALGVEGVAGVSPKFQINGLADSVARTCKPLLEVAQRADLLAAKERVEVAERGVFDAKAQFLPSLAVRTNAQGFILGGELFPIWNLQAVLTVPIWDGGARYGLLRDAHAQERQAVARREATDRLGRVDVARAQRGVEVATRAREIAASTLSEALKTDTLMRKAFDAGLGTSLELVTAASALRQQQLSLALRDYDVLRARVVALFALADCAQ